jgi:hypothetical protein
VESSPKAPRKTSASSTGCCPCCASWCEPASSSCGGGSCGRTIYVVITTL